MTPALFRDPRDYSPKELALLKIRVFIYESNLREAEAENIFPEYIKCLEELIRRFKEEIKGAIAL